MNPIYSTHIRYWAGAAGTKLSLSKEKRQEKELELLAAAEAAEVAAKGTEGERSARFQIKDDRDSSNNEVKTTH